MFVKRLGMKRRNIRDPAASGNGGDAQPIGKPWAINNALTEDLILINYIIMKIN